MKDKLSYLIGSDLVATQCYTYDTQFCTYPDDRCDDTPSNWQYCQTSCSPITGNTCVEVHSNGISDAFIPATSQRGDGSNSWRVNGVLVKRIEAFGVNHREEIDPSNGVMRSVFEEIFTGNVDDHFRIDRR